MIHNDDLVSVTLPKVLGKLRYGLAQNRTLFESACASRSPDTNSQTDADGFMRLTIEIINRSMFQAISELNQVCIAYRFISKDFKSLKQSEADSKALGFEESLSSELAQMFIRLGESISAGSSHKNSKSSQSNTDKKDELDKLIKQRVLDRISGETWYYAKKHLFKDLSKLKGGAA